MTSRVSVRRNLEQAKHCVIEALSVVEHDEPYSNALDDVAHAIGLLVEVKKRMSGEPMTVPR